MTTYQVDDNDQVIKLHKFPQSSVGAPLPVVAGGEGWVAVAYYLEEPPLTEWDGTTVGDKSERPIAIVLFGSCTTHVFGPPNDEALQGHPLASRGLDSYSAFEVLSSSWTRALERMNSVHPSHSREMFLGLRHFILTFHDSLFECVARSYEIHLSQAEENDYASISKMLKTVFEKR